MRHSRRIAALCCAVLLLVTGCDTLPIVIGRTAGCEPGSDAVRGGTSALGGNGPVMVATPDPYATELACRVLAGGGSAADAVVVAQLTLGLTEPQSSGPGGSAVAVYYDADSGETQTFAAVAHAPDGESRAPYGTALSAVGVPQTSRLLAALHADHGRTPIADLLAPIRDLATGGFATSRRLAGAIERRRPIFAAAPPWPELADGHAPAPGDRLTNPDYAAYLARLVDGDRLVDVGRTAAGALRAQTGGDVAAQRSALLADWRAEQHRPLRAAAPLCVPYREHRVCGSSSTGTGMMIVGETLGVLDRLDLPDPGETAVLPAATLHPIIEAQRLAFADAHAWMADPAADPQRSRAYRTLLVENAAHHARQAARIRRDRALTGLQPTALDQAETSYHDSDEEGTSQISVRAADGSFASLTTTLHQHFGSGIVVDGYFLNNSLRNFTAGAAATQPNGRRAGIAPRTAMAPLLIFRGDRPIAALGSPGGVAIPSYNLKVVLALLDWGYRPDRAVRLLNFGALGRDRVYLELPDPRDDPDGTATAAQLTVQQELTSRGHTVAATDGTGDDSALSLIVDDVRDGRLRGAADPRAGGAVRGAGRY